MRKATLSQPPVFSVASREDGHVVLSSDTAAIAHVFVLEDDIMRLLVLPEGDVKGPPSWAIAPGAEDIAEPGRDRMSVEGFCLPGYSVSETDDTITIESATIRLTIRRAGLLCLWEQADKGGWRRMMADRPTQAYDFGWWDGQVYHYLERDPGQRIYGLGEKSGPMDRTGRRFRFANLDPMGYDAEHSDPLYKTIPYMLVADKDNACFGMFYDNTGDLEINLGQELDNYHGLYRFMTSPSGDLDLYVISGPSPMKVTQRFTWMTGRPALMPRWSLGYSGSTMTYTDAPDAQDQMLGFLDKLAEHDIGCTSFHLSSGYTSIGAKRYVFNWNRDKFPDPKAFAAAYSDAGVDLVANIKPAFLRDHPLYADIAKAGHFVSDADGNPVEIQFWDEVGALLDFTRPEAAAWWREQVTSALLENGLRATWNDNNEYGVWDASARFSFFGEPRPAAEARPLQSMLMSRASRRAQTEHAPDKRPYTVTRSGMTGLQRYAQTWSGDNRTDWKSIRYNARMGLGLALSGVSNSGHDVGGFAGVKPDPELFVRWIQAGVLMPRFSIHSWNDDRSVNEPWMYPDMLPAIRSLMSFRQRIIPYLYDLLQRSHLHFEPMIRPLWLDHPASEASWIDGDSHLIGQDLLATLACDPGVESVSVHLPEGTDWIDPWTGTRHPGGSLATLPAPLDGLPPVLARCGSAIPVDLSQGGASKAPFQRGLAIFPTDDSQRHDWSFHEDDGESHDDCSIWQGQFWSNAHEVVVTVTRFGANRFGNGGMTIFLPKGDMRPLSVENLPYTPVEVEGKQAIRIQLD